MNNLCVAFPLVQEFLLFFLSKERVHSRFLWGNFEVLLSVLTHRRPAACARTDASECLPDCHERFNEPSESELSLTEVRSCDDARLAAHSQTSWPGSCPVCVTVSCRSLVFLWMAQFTQNDPLLILPRSLSCSLCFVSCVRFISWRSVCFKQSDRNF